MGVDNSFGGLDEREERKECRLERGGGEPQLGETQASSLPSGRTQPRGGTRKEQGETIYEHLL